jgi:hypothetical protein
MHYAHGEARNIHLGSEILWKRPLERRKKRREDDMNMDLLKVVCEHGRLRELL